MLQELIGRSQEGMVSLENRMQGLERMVENMSRDVAILTGRQENSPIMGFQNEQNTFSGKYYAASNHSNPKYRIGNDGGNTFPERCSSSNVIQSGNSEARESSWRLSIAGTDMWDNQAHDDEITRSDQILVGQSNSRRNFRTCKRRL